MKQSKKLTRNQRISLERKGVSRAEIEQLRFYRVLSDGKILFVKGDTLVLVNENGTLVPYKR